jgi:hypothetical protein
MDDTHPNVTYDPTWDVSTNPAIQDQYFNSTFQYVISDFYVLLGPLMFFAA